MSRARHVFDQYLSLLKVFGIATLPFDKSIPAKWRCAMAYLWLIFLFALIYSLLPEGDFYCANLSREFVVSGDTVREDPVRIGKELQQEIANTFRNAHGDQKVFEMWGIDASDFEVRFLKAVNKEGDVEMRFKLATTLTKTAGHERLYIDSTVTFSASERSSNQGRIYRPLQVEVPNVPNFTPVMYADFIKTLFPTESVGVGQSECQNSCSSTYLSTANMPISTGLNDRIVILGKGIKGDPTSLRGHFLRMLYLSAATITTLGTNDISPLTTRSRILIAVEVVMGIVLIGLFLNALAGEAGKK